MPDHHAMDPQVAIALADQAFHLLAPLLREDFTPTTDTQRLEIATACAMASFGISLGLLMMNGLPVAAHEHPHDHTEPAPSG